MVDIRSWSRVCPALSWRLVIAAIAATALLGGSYSPALAAQSGIDQPVTAPPLSIATENDLDTTDNDVTTPARPVTTVITGWRSQISRKASRELADLVVVTPALERTLKLQQRVDDRWITRRTFHTPRATPSAQIRVTFPKIWRSAEKTRWRLRVPRTATAKGATSRVQRVTSRLVYAPPHRFLQPSDRVKPAKGAGYSLTPGMNGVKVSQVQRRLGMGSRWETMDAATIAKVRNFQRSHGLRPTGIVNKKTWLQLGFTSDSWTKLDTWIHPRTVDRSATRHDRIEAMVDVVMAYRTSHYVWGGAGTVKNGADCSGMLLQALYAAGLNLRSIDTVKHARPAYRSSREMYAHPTLKRVPMTQRQRGDFLFWGVPGGAIGHVGLYLGNGNVAHILPQGFVVQKVPSRVGQLTLRPTLVRPFP